MDPRQMANQFGFKRIVGVGGGIRTQLETEFKELRRKREAALQRLCKPNMVSMDPNRTLDFPNSAVEIGP